MHILAHLSLPRGGERGSDNMCVYSVRCTEYPRLCWYSCA